ncbi:uncharacterized protein SOCE26_100560 [Sorangium cellulosum]|uniref:Secreted protein n=1 Tax=Sorangium cellulosum TaxID=56 RepID=A0A2L0FA99_SORCE|nr:hypothetical protein [Sorangium cellulosum]AUX48518.1 uncharacterized protein SOCE26_100560 [Sorangium cellulosum]
MKQSTFVTIFPLMLATACGAAGEPDDQEAAPEIAASQEAISLSPDFAARYLDCEEFAGVGLAPFASVASLVPDDYVVIEAAPGMAIVVAQAADCAEISVNGHLARPGVFAQLGVGVVPPTGTGDRNFYQIAFATTHPSLAARLRLLGVNARYAPFMSYEITNVSGTQADLGISVPRPAGLAFDLNGPITLPDASGPSSPPTTFNYWHQSAWHGNILQENAVTGIRLGEGSAVTLTAVGDDLEAILGGTTLTFPFFSSPELFDEAVLTVQTDAF